MIFGLAREQLRGRGLWLALGCYIAGLTLGRALVPGPAVALGLAAAMVALALATAGRVRPGRFSAVLLALAAVLGVLREAREVEVRRSGRELAGWVREDKVRVLFRCDEEPELEDDYTVWWGTVLAVEAGDGWTPLRSRVRLTVGDRVEGVYRGDRVVGLARLKRPRDFRNPGGFEYEQYLERRGVFVTAYVSRSRDLVRVEAGFSALGLIDRGRERFIARLSVLPGRGGALLRALLAGDRKALDPDLTAVFQDTGLAHLLSISGLHLALLAAAVYFGVDRAVRRFPAVVNRVASGRAAALATMPAVIAYAALTGMRTPTQRALVMTLAYLAAVALDRRRETWNALAAAAGAILLMWPEAWQEISFQLSFISVAGILYLHPRVAAIGRGERGLAERELDRLEKSLGAAGPGRLDRVGAYLLGLLAVSLEAHWILFPYMANAFHLVNPLSPLYNVAAIPVIGLVLLPGGLLASLLALIAPGPAGIILTILADIGGSLLDSIMYCSRAAPTVVPVPPLSSAGILAWYGSGVLLVEALVAFRRRVWSWRLFSSGYFRLTALEDSEEKVPLASPRAARAVGVAGLVLLLIFVGDLARDRDPFPAGRAALAALDVGQAQALMYRSGEGHWLLVDGGGFYKSGFDMGRGVTGPCLLGLGARRLDAVVLTHPHPDHAGGLPYILKHFKVGEFWHGPGTSDWFTELDGIARSRGIPIRILDRAAGTFDFYDIRVSVLSPPADAIFDLDDLNNQSLVLRLESARSVMVLFGDVERDMEARLARDYGPGGLVDPDLLRARVMSVPHHGSKTSSTPALLDAASPLYALVSAGGYDNNRLPAAEALERYRERGIMTLRTDRDGFIAVTAWGDTVERAEVK